MIIACRDEKRALVAAKEISKAANVDDKMVTFGKLDLTSFKSVREFAEKINKGIIIEQFYEYPLNLEAFENIPTSSL